MIGSTAVSDNNMVPYLFRSLFLARGVRVAIVLNAWRNAFNARAVTFDPWFGLPFSCIGQTNTARTSNAPNTTS